MAYDAALSVMMVGITFILAFLSTKFNEDQSVLQLFFLILTLAFIAADVAVLANVLRVKSVDSSIIGIIDGIYTATIWIVIVFISVVMFQFLRKTLINPYEKGISEETYSDYSESMLNNR